MRHAGVLSALLATAALMCAMPGLTRMDTNRVPQALRPARLRTLTVWLMPGDVGDRKLLNQLCAAFEKNHSGARVFMRVVTPDEFEGETAVLPDVALFETGQMAAPENVFLPLENQNAPSGMYAGRQLALPLWYAPNVLSLPQTWLRNRPFSQPSPAQTIPWGMLVEQGAIEPPEGVGCQQLLATCPPESRARLVGAALGASDGASSARVETLARHEDRKQNGEELVAFTLIPAVSDRVRYAALCRDSEDARAFLCFLLERTEQAAQHKLTPATQADALPNAFAHTRAELMQLCQSAFDRCDDPALSLLALR